MSHSNTEGPSLSEHDTCGGNTKSSLGKRKYDTDTPVSSQHADPGLGRAILTEVGRMADAERGYTPDLISPSVTGMLDWHNSVVSDKSPRWIDGTDKRGKNVLNPVVPAIFIHAGAGYHSTANEKLHLDACSDAARAAMKLLKEGFSAIEAVEAAIKILEDKEITNAGFGSNLAIDGTVECDATIVDHLGRSGACGAVPNIKNPISLAKVILEETHKPLTLRRVPPNLLVGKGAKDFAWEHGMPLIPNEWLVTRNAKDRYKRWKADLDLASSLAMTPLRIDQGVPAGGDTGGSHQKKNQRDHANAISMGTWNEGQPDSPAQPATPSENGSLAMPPASPHKSGPLSPQGPSSPKASKGTGERSPLSFLGSLGSPMTSNPGSSRSRSPASKKTRHKWGQDTGIEGSGGGKSDQLDARDRASSPTSSARPNSPRKHMLQPSEDRISDTVGAIAIDQYGFMAAGSSSGGIGMKHRGRVGPAALVGVGTAIIPSSTGFGAYGVDEDHLAVGVVTSGTGEHMATTQASQRCAERLYHGTRRGPNGSNVDEPEESIVMESFIANDFQGHPSVMFSSSASAIGAMAVKQTRRGYYLYFAHNTDSFALASMCGTDRNPHCAMSRLPERSTGIAQGARKICAV